MSKSPYDLIKEQKQLIADCQEFAGELTEWEHTFLDSILGRLNRHIPLSEKQNSILTDLKKKLIERLD